MLAACRLAGLFGLEGHYAGVNASVQFGPTRRSRDKPHALQHFDGRTGGQDRESSARPHQKAAGDTDGRDVVIDDHQAAMPHRAFKSARSGFMNARLTG